MFHRRSRPLSPLSLLSLLLLASALLVAPACGGDDDGDGDAAPAADCPDPTAGPTMHSGDVEDGEVWTADGSPHIVTGDVNVRDGATLTIEPCAQVRMAAGAHIHVAYPSTPNSGTLIAEGTAERPITISGDGGARWASLYVEAPGTARLSHVTLQGGGASDQEHGATLLASGDGADGADALVLADQVTIVGSAGAGAWMRRGAAFMAGSTGLTIEGSGSEERPYPLEIEEPTIATLPDGSYQGNQRDEILIDPVGGEVAGSGLLEDATLRDHGVPYVIGRSTGSSLRIGGGPDGSLAVLTIEAGVVLKFQPEGGLSIQHATNDRPATAALRVLGSASAPVIFTSVADSPAAGDWRGLWFGGVPSAMNQIEHARIEYAGADCSCTFVTCSAIEDHDGAVVFSQQPPGAFITDTVIAHSAGHGITQGFDGDLVNFRPSNSFEDVAGCPQTHPRNPDTSCPEPEPACDGLE